MKSIDDEIKFHLSKTGWYLGEIEIEVVDNINGVDVVTGAFDSKKLCYYANGKIYMSQAVVRYASLPQRRIIALHEYAHRFPVPEGTTKREIEYACDRWALGVMIRSGDYNISELKNAITAFGEIVNEVETETYPSSKDRYKRLKKQLRESV
jgi:hypothetical protein